jgi:hypothetical protein
MTLSKRRADLEARMQRRLETLAAQDPQYARMLGQLEVLKEWSNVEGSDSGSGGSGEDSGSPGT